MCSRRTMLKKPYQGGPTTPSAKQGLVHFRLRSALFDFFHIIMTNVILSAKFGSDWTDNELTGFNIQVDTVDAATFFNTAQLPAPLVPPMILTNEKRPEGFITKPARLFFQYMKDAVTGEESLVNDFAAFLLSMFGYDEPDRVIHQRKEVSFVMCGTVVAAKPDVCVMMESQYLLFVQECKVCHSYLFSYLSCWT